MRPAGTIKAQDDDCDRIEQRPGSAFALETSGLLGGARCSAADSLLLWVSAGDLGLRLACSSIC
jgi:hypothetical protein